MNFGHWVDHAGIVGKRNFCQCHLDRGLLEVVVIKVVIIVAPQWEVMGRFQANTGNPALRLTSKFRDVLNLSGTAVATNSGGVAPGGQRLERGVGVRRPSTRLSAPACSGDQQLKLTTALHCQMCGDLHLTQLLLSFLENLSTAHQAVNEIFCQILQILSRASLPASLGLMVAIDTSESVGPFLFFFGECLLRCLLTISINIPLVYWSPLVPES